MIRTQEVCFNGKSHYVHREHSFGGQTHIARSHMLVCPKCRQTWAWLKFVDDTLCWPQGQFCKDCGATDYWHPVPGSLLVEEGYGVIDESLLDKLPLELLQREFELHIKAYNI